MPSCFTLPQAPLLLTWRLCGPRGSATYVRLAHGVCVCGCVWCTSRCCLTTNAMCSWTLQHLTRYQEWGGLSYPSDKLMHVMDKFKFIDTVLKENPTLYKLRTAVFSSTIPALCSLHCSGIKPIKIMSSESSSHNWYSRNSSVSC